MQAGKQSGDTKGAASLPADRYAGRYRDAWYGDVVVGSDARGLTVDFTSTPNMAGRLSHWAYNSFITDFDDKSLEKAIVTFAINEAGKVTGVTMKPANPIADFSWDYHDLDLKPVEAGK
jgi:hypothetical protein